MLLRSKACIVLYGWNSCAAPTIMTLIRSMEFLLSFQVSSASVDRASGHYVNFEVVCSPRCTFSLATNSRVVDEHTYPGLVAQQCRNACPQIYIFLRNTSILFNPYFSTFSRDGKSKPTLPSVLPSLSGRSTQ